MSGSWIEGRKKRKRDLRKRPLFVQQSLLWLRDSPLADHATCSGLTRDRYGRGASLLPAFSGPADLIVVGQVLRVLIFCAAFLPFPSSVVSPPPVFAAILSAAGFTRNGPTCLVGTSFIWQIVSTFGVRSLRFASQNRMFPAWPTPLFRNSKSAFWEGHFAGYTTRRLCTGRTSHLRVRSVSRAFFHSNVRFAFSAMCSEQQRQKFQIWKGRYLRNVGKYSPFPLPTVARSLARCGRRRKEARLEGRQIGGETEETDRIYEYAENRLKFAF